MKKKWIEAGKTVLIIALVLNAALLLARIALSQNGMVSTRDVFLAAQRLFQRAAADQTETVEAVSQAAQPVQAAVMQENGRCGIIYGFDELDELYNKVGAVFKEALGSAGEAAAVDERAWQAALESQGVYFAFGVNIPVSVLAGWRSTTSTLDFPACRYILSCGNSENVTLLLSDGESYYACETSAQTQSLCSQLEYCRPNGAQFAFELTDRSEVYNNVDPYSIVLEGMNSALAKYASVPVLEKAETSLMEQLMLNPYTKNSYTDKDGWHVYLFSSGTLKLRGDGQAVFSARSGEDVDLLKAQRYGNDGISIASAIESTRAFAENTVGMNRGDARIYMSGYDVVGDTVTVTYSYYLEGLRTVTPQSGYAAQFTFVNGFLVEIALNYRSYTRLDETVDILMPLYAAAIYPKDSRLLLVAGYIDSDTGSTVPSWINA